MTGSRRDLVIAACSAKPGTVEDYPFGDEVAVFKVAGRMFALVPLGEAPGSVSLKCNPDLAVGLRGRYAGVTPGYHLNKRHWNTVPCGLGKLHTAAREKNSPWWLTPAASPPHSSRSTSIASSARRPRVPEVNAGCGGLARQHTQADRQKAQPATG